MRSRPPLSVGAELRPLTDREFALFQALIHGAAGIHLNDSKKALLFGRLSGRIKALGLASFGAYYDYVQRHGEAELTRLLDAVSTNETHFFREPQHFTILEQHVFPRWLQEAASGRRPRRIRAWSAASSTGEEPYSLAMALLSHFPPSAGWSVEILGTDISTRVLERARTAVWPIAAARDIPQAYLKRFMLRGTGEQEGRMRASPELRQVVRFERLNLNDERYDVAGPFDLIFCRNVLIYFNPEGKQRVVQRLLDHLAPDGYFFLGHAEGLTGASQRTRALVPTVYMLADSPVAAAARRGAGSR